MGNAKSARGGSPVATLRSANRSQGSAKRIRRDHGATAPTHEPLGLRERKKARLRQEIIKTAVKLFRKRGYENTRVDDIVQILEISQPTFFRYFPSKDAVLCEVGRRGFDCITEHLKSELSSEATTAERLRRLYQALARETESDRPLWQAVVLSGAMDPVHSPDMRGRKEFAIGLLREILAEGQKRGEVSRAFPVAHLAEFMEGLHNTVVRQWAVDLTGPHRLTERVRSAVEFFLRGVQP
ncbi:MAG: TetR/AcrR family transcriptional regulator [Candidatus Acidiferrales bacterium]